jgi:hypothetical protein
MQPAPSKLSPHHSVETDPNVSSSSTHHGIIQDGVLPSDGQVNRQDHTSRSSDGTVDDGSRLQILESSDDETLNPTTEHDTRQMNIDGLNPPEEQLDDEKNRKEARFDSELNIQSLPNGKIDDITCFPC